MSNYKDLHIEFPGSSTTAAVKMGSEPKSETVISYFAQPHANDPMEQEVALAVTDTLEIGLRDILREELGQTYTVSVDLSQLAPQVGDDHVEISFGAAPENIDKMTARVREEVEKMKKDGPTDDLLNRAKETARRNYETQLKQNAYWLGRFQAVKLWGQDPVLIAHRNERIAAVTAAAVKDAYNKYFPEGRSTDVTLMPAK
jgi:zinc protease